MYTYDVNTLNVCETVFNTLLVTENFFGIRHMRFEIYGFIKKFAPSVYK